MVLSDVMAALATQIDTIAGLRVYAWPADAVQPPAAVVGFPESYTYDSTMKRGADELTLPVWVVVSRVSDRTAATALGAYVDGAGAASVKAVVEAGTYTAMDAVRVTGVEFVPLVIAGADYWSAMFNVFVIG